MSKLCKCVKSTKWYPHPISKLDNFLSQLYGTNNAISRNISYNIQYIEYLNKSIKDLNLSEVIIKQTYKNIIIIGVSIIEAIFFKLLERIKDYKTNDWKQIKKFTNNINSEEQIITEYQKKTDKPQIIPMGLDTMCNKIIGKKLLGINFKHYKNIKQLKHLRNKIHIHSIKSLLDTDYNSFGFKEYTLIQKFLYELFNCEEIFKDKTDMFDFLNT